jgi:FKBP-type peptidyl-prolyl cis-trans isomerase FkpA
MKQIVQYLLLIFLVGCQGRSPYPGYSTGADGIFYKLIKIGETSRKAQYGDYITVDISYRTMSDSIFFSGRRKLQLSKPGFTGSIDECFTMLAKGDSASFIISADQFFFKTLENSLPSFIQPKSMMKVSIGIVEIQTRSEYEKEKEAFLRWIDDFGEYEKILLQQFLRQEQLPVKPTGSGMYYLKVREGKGKKIAIGDTITINYEGRFLNGKFFDSTVRSKQPFQFVYGTEWQVVKGMEEAIGMMQEGEKALIILPSDLAFGREGSSTGIIPPFTSLIFEVEIIKVN